VHDDDEKFYRLLQLLGVWYEKGNVLVFVETQAKCDNLFAELMKAGYPCLSLHGSMDQMDRDSTIQVSALRTQ
jgi:ATP-dependent RNA helicase DDX46/PRP5